MERGIKWPNKEILLFRRLIYSIQSLQELEAANLRAEEKARVAEVNAESRKKEVAEKEAAAAKDRQELVAHVNALQLQLQRLQIDPKHIIEEASECCVDSCKSLPLTKHVDLSKENVDDKACLNVTKAIPVSEETIVQMPVDQASLRDGKWISIQATESSIEDVREIRSLRRTEAVIARISPSSASHLALNHFAVGAPLMYSLLVVRRRLYSINRIGDKDCFKCNTNDRF